MPIDKEFKDKYNQIKESTVIRIRLDAKEQALLDSMMREENWGNKNQFIKTKLFGKSVMSQVHRNIVDWGGDFDMQNLLRRETEELTRACDYIGALYNKSLEMFEAGSNDLNRFISATREAMVKFLRRSEELAYCQRLLGRKLGVNFGGAETRENKMTQKLQSVPAATKKSDTKEAERRQKDKEMDAFFEENGIDLSRHQEASLPAWVSFSDLEAGEDE